MDEDTYWSQQLDEYLKDDDQNEDLQLEREDYEYEKSQEEI
ncbi:hypothetical protein RD055328_08700 [Companilactobacillus sp. RD055328]|nr:hypothetical protein [Companilactobacillus sp. RD055328]GKQ42947.1 hypothetical protein RD055328_08700 [Companilactobacillus sp. RD055328]